MKIKWPIFKNPGDGVFAIGMFVLGALSMMLFSFAIFNGVSDDDIKTIVDAVVPSAYADGVEAGINACGPHVHHAVDSTRAALLMKSLNADSPQVRGYCILQEVCVVREFPTMDTTINVCVQLPALEGYVDIYKKE